MSKAKNKGKKPTDFTAIKFLNFKTITPYTKPRDATVRSSVTANIGGNQPFQENLNIQSTNTN